MNHFFKLVASMLVLVALASPAAAVTTCWISAPANDVGMECPPECPMMAEGVEPHSMAPQDGSCCQISSRQPAPVAVTQLPVSASQVSIGPADAPIPVVSEPSDANEQVASAALSAPETSPQALLCTFLI